MDIKRELYNVFLLKEYFLHFGIDIALWSLADGVARRMKLKALYQKTHYHRYQSCKKYLKKKYGYIIEKYKKSSMDSKEIGENSVIWRYWYQGIDKAPYPVGLCLDSLKGKMGAHREIILDKDNYRDYVNLPEYVTNKMERGQISIAIFSDFLRLALLKKYGGIWLDSTAYLNAELPDEVGKSKFYSIKQNNRRKWVVTQDLWSVCMLAAGVDNILIHFCYDFLCEYWKEENVPVGYLMTDCIIALGYEYIPAIRKMIDQVPDNNIHFFAFLEEFRNQKYDAAKLAEMNRNTYIYKLTYKLPYKKRINGQYTNFGALLHHR